MDMNSDQAYEKMNSNFYTFKKSGFSSQRIQTDLSILKFVKLFPQKSLFNLVIIID